MRRKLTAQIAAASTALLVGASLAPRVVAQTDTQSEEAAPPVFGVEAAAVILDVVVRDKKGRTVRDLTQADFQVFEDGRPQDVIAFRLVDKGARDLARQPVTPPKVDPTEAADADSETPLVETPVPEGPAGQPSLIAFVFDRMTTEGRDMSLKAARQYTRTGHVAGDLVGVFTIDLTLNTIQHFTTELEEINTAFERAAQQADTPFASGLEENRRLLEQAQSMESAGAGGDPSSGVQQANNAAASAMRAQVRMMRGFEALERDQQGYATTNGLLSVVSGLAPLPGRKTVIFFSEGMAIPSNVQAQFRSVIATANRSNVSVYAMDAGGLRVTSTLKQSRDELVAAANQAMQNAMSDYSRSDGALTQGMERSEDMLRLDPHAGLGQLADETGGFLIKNTNDASKAFGRIEEDMRFHYVLTYSPADASYDGRFRAIKVDVKRKGLQVQSRNGYFAVPPSEGSVVPVREFEAPALAQLARSTLPTALPIQAGAFTFPEAERPGLVPVIVELPSSAITYELDEEKQNYEADLVIVARIEDKNKQEVQRMSERYPLIATPENLESARQGNVLFYKEADLAPGTYTLEAVAYDSRGDKAGATTRTIEVGGASGGMRLSSLMLVRRMEELKPSDQSTTPLRFQNLLLYPDLGQPFSQTANERVGYYFNVYGASGMVTAAFEVWQGEERISEGKGPLPAADAEGRIQYAGVIPIKGLATGDYELRVTVRDGAGSTDHRVVPLTVIP